MSDPASKKQRTHPQYEILYHPGIPGRAAYIKLPLEAAGVPYSDIANEKKSGYSEVMSYCSAKSTGDGDGNPPIFAPPALRVPGAGKDGKALVISQTPAILLYLGSRLDMVPEDEPSQMHVHSLALTALDLSNEAHDAHHPIAVSLRYEDQQDAALTRSKDFRTKRIPKFFSFFERTLEGNEEQGKGRYLVGDKLSYADTTLWHVIDGLHFAFPKEMAARKKEFPMLFDTFYPSFKEEKGIKEYLSSERRLPFGNGLFRDYPELDRQ